MALAKTKRNKTDGWKGKILSLFYFFVFLFYLFIFVKIKVQDETFHHDIRGSLVAVNVVVLKINISKHFWVRTYLCANQNMKIKLF